MLDYRHYRGIDINRLGGFFWLFYLSLKLTIATVVPNYCVTGTKIHQNVPSVDIV